MRKSERLIKAEHVDGLTLRLTFGDGLSLMADFSGYFRDRATPSEKRYARPEWFKRFKLLDEHALMWGDFLILFSTESLRKWHVRGVTRARKVAA